MDVVAAVGADEQTTAAVQQAKVRSTTQRWATKAGAVLGLAQSSV